MRSVIGLVGPIASGKGTVAQMFRERGYEYYSLSDMIREEAVRRGLDLKVTRILQDLGDELRQKFGEAVLAERTVRKINMSEGRKIVIDSIRHPAEARFLKGALKATIVGVDALADIRWRRFQERGRDTNVKTIEEFLALDARETQEPDEPYKIDVTGCLKLADFTITNEGTPDDLMNEVGRFFKETKETDRRRKEG